MPDYDVKLIDGTHERVTAPGERAAAVAAQQVTGLPVDQIDELQARMDPATGGDAGSGAQAAA